MNSFFVRCFLMGWIKDLKPKQLDTIDIFSWVIAILFALYCLGTFSFTAITGKIPDFLQLNPEETLNK